MFYSVYCHDAEYLLSHFEGCALQRSPLSVAFATEAVSFHKSKLDIGKQENN